MEFLVADQRIGYIAERALNGLPVRNQSLLVLRLGYSQISAKSSPGENGRAHLSAVRPVSDLRTHQAGESGASSKGPSSGARQDALCEALALGDADSGVGGA